LYNNSVLLFKVNTHQIVAAESATKHGLLSNIDAAVNPRKNQCLYSYLSACRSGRSLLRLWVRIPPDHGYLSVMIVVCCQVEVSAMSW